MILDPWSTGSSRICALMVESAAFTSTPLESFKTLNIQVFYCLESNEQSALKNTRFSSTLFNALNCHIFILLGYKDSNLHLCICA